MKDNGKKICTLDDVKSALETFVSEVRVATGKGQTRPRFIGFTLQPEVRSVYEEALKLLADGKLTPAKEKAEEVLRLFRGKQRAYCVKSIDSYFEPRIQNFAETCIYKDLIEAIEAKFDDLKRALEVASKQTTAEVDFDGLSSVYWTLVDALKQAPIDRDARDANARMLVRAGGGSRKQKARVAELDDLDAQIAAEKERREQEAQRAAANRRQMVEEFSAAL